jgi:peptide deformylase
MPSSEPKRVLPIVQAGDPVLRQRAAFVTPADLRLREFVDLIEAMRETMRSAPGVGLAAPQIGESLAIAVIEDRADYQARLSPEELQQRDRRPVPFHVIANPRLTVIDSTPVAFSEGCLSVVGYAAVTPRATAVRVDALDHRGEPVTIEASGWYARILQHEIDHLLGNLYVDRMDSRTFTFLGAPPPPDSAARQR